MPINIISQRQKRKLFLVGLLPVCSSLLLFVARGFIFYKQRRQQSYFTYKYLHQIHADFIKKWTSVISKRDSFDLKWGN